MCATFTDGDIDKRVENATNETIGIITAIEDEDKLAYVTPRSGLVDSIRAAVGWDEPIDEPIPIRASAVDEITEDAVRLGTEPLDHDAADEEAIASIDDDHEQGGDTLPTATLEDALAREIAVKQSESDQESTTDADTPTVDTEATEPPEESTTDVDSEATEPPEEHTTDVDSPTVDSEATEPPEEPTSPAPTSPPGDSPTPDTDEQKIVDRKRDQDDGDTDRESSADERIGDDDTDRPAPTDSADATDATPLGTETDLESILEDDRESTPSTIQHDAVETGVDVEPTDITTDVEPAQPQPWIAGHTMLDSENAVGRSESSPSATDDHHAGETAMSDQPSTGVGSAVLALQRSALAGPTRLFSQSVTLQREASGVALSALSGQLRLQQLGLETFVKTTTTPLRVGRDTSQPERDRSQER